MKNVSGRFFGSASCLLSRFLRRSCVCNVPTNITHVLQSTQLHILQPATMAMGPLMASWTHKPRVDARECHAMNERFPELAVILAAFVAYCLFRVKLPHDVGLSFRISGSTALRGPRNRMLRAHLRNPGSALYVPEIVIGIALLKSEWSELCLPDPNSRLEWCTLISSDPRASITDLSSALLPRKLLMFSYTRWQTFEAAQEVAINVPSSSLWCYLYGVSILVKLSSRPNKHSLEFMLVEVNLCLNPSPLPLPVHLFVESGDQAVTVPFGGNVSASLFPSLMSSTGLVLTLDFRFGDFVPLRETEQMLRLNVLVAQKERVLHHLDKICSWHCVCLCVIDTTIVYLVRWV